MPHIHRRLPPPPVVAHPAWLVALALAAPFLTAADVSAANQPEAGGGQGWSSAR